MRNHAGQFGNQESNQERKVFQIDLVIETGMQEGMMSLNRSLSNLVRKKKFLWRMPNFTRLIRGIEDTLERSQM